MIRVSDSYKIAMDSYLRDNAYVIVAIGVVDPDAQKALQIEGELDDEYTWWSNLITPVRNIMQDEVDYATLEQNFLLCDGTQRFLPNREDWNEYGAYCVISKDIMGPVHFILDGEYDVKGVTINFTENYPTKFKIISDAGETIHENDSPLFKTSTAIGQSVTYFSIIPLEMKGGQQRLRIKSVLMGVGLYLTNDEISDLSLSEECSPISEELSETSFSVDVLDYEDNYNVDNPDAYINYLISKQSVNVQVGMTLEDGTIEYLTVANLWLSSWSSAYGTMSFTANGKLSFFNSVSYKSETSQTIHSRSIYDDCIDILTDMGLESTEYIVDEYLQTRTIINPLPEASHAQLLQLLANAGRCILFQDNLGRICIKVNFPYSLTEDDYELSTDTNAPWGSLDHILDDSVEIYYADFTQDFSIVNGSMYVLPEDSEEYMDGTSYVSSDVSNEQGYFTNNPSITLDIVAGFDFTNLMINFAGNPPTKLIAHTSWAGRPNEDVVFEDLELENDLQADFGTFDSITIEIPQTVPYNRVLISYIALGMGNSYRLDKDKMMEFPMGQSEETVATVSVRIFTFENGEDGPKQVEDDNYYTLRIADKGTDVTFENQLINTQAMAQEVAEWLGNYYKNDITYNLQYRGEPRLKAGDYIKMDNDYNENLVVEIEQSELTFNGAFGGSLALRRSLKEV